MIEVHRLHLTDVTPSPELPWARPTFPVFSYLVLHPSGPIIIDTGVGVGSSLIDGLYAPVHHDLDEALDRHGVAVDQVSTVISSHLHFDHCGQNARFAHATVIVQRAEAEAARAPRYTVPEWAFPPGVDLLEVDGDHQVASGVEIIATPGHTPGHQSVLVDDGAGTRTVVGGQAAWDVGSFASANLGDEGWDQGVGAASLQRLHGLRPHHVVLSHDPADWRPGLR